MCKIYKIVFIWCLLLSSTKSFSQLNEYLDDENRRILLSQKTEVEIQKFIDDNFDKYKLSHEVSDKIIQHLKEEEEFTEDELKNAIKKEKVYELRKLFFLRNPDEKKNYVANPLPATLSQQCVNGDFENNTAGYTFWSDAHPQPDTGDAFFMSCATVTSLNATNGITPTTNNFNSTVTLISNTNGGYQQFDPTLAGLGVNVPTLYAAGGHKCIKLNNEAGLGSSDQTTVSRYFPNINEATIDFNFSLIMDNKPAHEQAIQPFFRVRVLDQFSNVVDEICIIANPNNCLFNVLYISRSRRVLYTNWICARLNVGEILNQPGTIEFTVSDCAPSAHFGTVYIDNICGATCAVPQLGSLNLNPANIDCPDITTNVPIMVCGTYQSPVNATLNTISLDITQNNVVIGTINTPTQLTASTFCFSVLPSLFGAIPNGDFEFDVHATFNVNCPAGAFIYDIYDHSANVGPDVTFENCCVATLTLASPIDDLTNLASSDIIKKERSDWIKASNIVSVGDNTLSNGVVYHAANFVELNPGFEAVFGSQFAAYPEGCTDNFVYRNAVATNSPVSDEDIIINLVKIGSMGFAIIPNPSNSIIAVVMKDSNFNKVSITTIDGKIVDERSVENTDTTRIDVSRYANGIYIINVTTEDGRLLSKKLIKN